MDAEGVIGAEAGVVQARDEFADGSDSCVVGVVFGGIGGVDEELGELVCGSAEKVNWSGWM